MATVASERNVARATGAARPRTRFVLIGHLAFTILNATLFGNTVWVLPMLVQLRFGASDDALRAWQTMAITAAIPTALVLSIFWGELLRRMSLRVYLLLFWLVTIVPLGGIGLVTNYWQLLVLNLISAVGLAGWAPVSGTLLKRFYPDSHHGRIYAVLSMAAHAAGLATVYLVGIWLERDPNAFRIYLPLSAATYLLGVLMLCLLVRVTGPDAPPRVRTTRSWSALVQPIFSMHRVLAQDRTFARYEAAFMTYGGVHVLRCPAAHPGDDQARHGLPGLRPLHPDGRQNLAVGADPADRVAQRSHRRGAHLRPLLRRADGLPPAAAQRPVRDGHRSGVGGTRHRPGGRRHGLDARSACTGGHPGEGAAIHGHPRHARRCARRAVPVPWCRSLQADGLVHRAAHRGGLCLPARISPNGHARTYAAKRAPCDHRNVACQPPGPRHTTGHRRRPAGLQSGAALIARVNSERSAKFTTPSQFMSPASVIVIRLPSAS
ncbi:MAG: MFS transporter [Phycisphaerales bacterium]|nr:MFS transporter [Phycisphaerales bacterium]